LEVFELVMIYCVCLQLELNDWFVAELQIYLV